MKSIAISVSRFSIFFVFARIQVAVLGRSKSAGICYGFTDEVTIGI